MVNTPPDANSTILSVIIPIFNVEQYLEECLESVVKQNRPALEVILVDDGSTDNSASIASEYATRFDNWHLLSHKENRGLGPARNTALDFANGNYVMMLDSDDWLELDAVSSTFLAIRKDSTDVIQFACNKVHQNGEQQITRVEKNVYRSDFEATRSLLDHQKKLLSMPSYACLKVVRRELVEKLNLRFENIYYEDVPWSISLTLHAQSIRLIATPIFNYRQRAESITFTKSTKHLDLLKAYGSMFDLLAHSVNGQQLKQSLADAFLSSSYYLNRHKSKRLRSVDMDSFKKQYQHIIKSQKIRPGTLRTSAMMLITAFQLWFMDK